MNFNILQRRTGIEKEINDFLDQVSQAGLIFQQGITIYLAGDFEKFTAKLDDIADTEHKGDHLRRSIEEHLYSKTLIPESRGDVLELIEQMDSLLDRFKGALWRFEIERPQIDDDFIEDFIELIAHSVETVEAIVRSARAFFTNITEVANHIHKVHFWETEADKCSTRLLRAIFRKENLHLSHRMLLRDLVHHLDRIADRAEDVADRLNIYVIKRML
jgi:predicted phosphate transport protein (TIGR00153 family)